MFKKQRISGSCFPLWTHIAVVAFSTRMLTLDVEYSFNADLVHPFLTKFSPNAEDLVSIGGHHPDASVIQFTPSNWPLFTQLLHPLHDLKHLDAPEKNHAI